MNRMAIRAAIDRSALTKSQKLCLHDLVRIDSKTIHVGVTRMAYRLKLCERTVRMAFREFERCGILRLIAKEHAGCVPRVYAMSVKAIYALPRVGQKCPTKPYPANLPHLSGAKMPRITKSEKQAREQKALSRAIKRSQNVVPLKSESA